MGGGLVIIGAVLVGILISFIWIFLNQTTIHERVRMETAYWDSWEEDMKRKNEQRLARIDEIMKMSDEERRALFAELTNNAEQQQ